MKIGKLWIGRKVIGPKNESTQLACWFQPTGHWRWVLFHGPKNGWALPRLSVGSGRISVYLPNLGELTLFVFPDFTKPQFAKYLDKNNEA